MRPLIVLLCCLLCLPVLAQEATEQAEPFVIATHYPNFGDTEPAPMRVIQASYNNYNNATNDYYAVTQSQVDAVIAKIHDGAPNLDILIWNAWDEAQEDSAALQVVNNVPIENALYTIFLPPNWNKLADLPIVISGNGAGTSNNRRFYGSGEADMGIIVGLSATLGSGVIGVMSNTGGTESQGVNEGTYRSVGALFDFLHDNGGDKENIIAAGWSRGGGSAIMWAVNPLGLDYNIHTVFAGIPPASYGGLAIVTPSTYPNMSSIATLISGDDQAYRFDHDGPMKPGMIPSPFLEVILGEGDPYQADQISIMGNVEAMRGKALVIDVGSHDAFFSMRFVLDYDRVLTAAGIPHTTAITYNSGHEDTDFVRNLLVTAIASAMFKQPFTPPDGRFFAIDLAPIDDQEVSLEKFYADNNIDADPNQLMVHMEVPFRIGQGDPFDVAVCGPVGTNVSVMLVPQGDSDKPVFEIPERAIPETECLVKKYVGDFPVGAYTWLLYVDDELVNTANSAGVVRGEGEMQPCSQESAFYVEETQPNPDKAHAGLGNMSYGVLQYAPEASCIIGGITR